MYMYIYTHINQATFKTKVLQKPREIAEGMMGKIFHGQPFEALLFVMKKSDSAFWMKNCIVPLDVVFIHDGKVSKIYHNCKPCTKDPCKTYPGTGNLVMELPGGTCKHLGIKNKTNVLFTYDQ
uniref:DUF192 domain-containing protein n=1 Tax=viral metagenome TaxID=1070528 RepID=A0A6C0B086_9ZZZZ